MPVPPITYLRAVRCTTRKPNSHILRQEVIPDPTIENTDFADHTDSISEICGFICTHN